MISPWRAVVAMLIAWGLQACIRSRTSSMDDVYADCQQTCDWVRGPAPGEATRILGPGSPSGGGADSVVWPVAFAEPTWVILKVAGVLPQVWTIAGTDLPDHAARLFDRPIDANGLFWDGRCRGHVITAFRAGSGGTRDNITRCPTGNNGPESAPVILHLDSGVVAGTGFIRRVPIVEPVETSGRECRERCVLVAGGAQTVTLTPGSVSLGVDASVDTIAQPGESVTFTATAGRHDVSAIRWYWVPHRPRGSATDRERQATVPTPTFEACESLVCHHEIAATGTMYVSAVVQGVREQASTIVIVRSTRWYTTIAH